LSELAGDYAACPEDEVVPGWGPPPFLALPAQTAGVGETGLESNLISQDWPSHFIEQPRLSAEEALGGAILAPADSSYAETGEDAAEAITRAYQAALQSYLAVQQFGAKKKITAGQEEWLRKNLSLLQGLATLIRCTLESSAGEPSSDEDVKQRRRLERTDLSLAIVVAAVDDSWQESTQSFDVSPLGIGFELSRERARDLKIGTPLIIQMGASLYPGRDPAGIKAIVCHVREFGDRARVGAEFGTFADASAGAEVAVEIAYQI
jgi:hypothetical protein